LGNPREGKGLTERRRGYENWVFVERKKKAGAELQNKKKPATREGGPFSQRTRDARENFERENGDISAWLDQTKKREEIASGGENEAEEGT